MNLVAKMGGGGKRVNAERYDGLVRVLQNCTVSVEKHGPFKSFSWAQTTDADQMVGIFALRTLTYGSTLKGVKKVCVECEHRWEAEPNLLPIEEGGDLCVFPMGDDALEALAGAGLMPAHTLPSGVKVVCRVLVGTHRKEAVKLAEELGEDPVIAGIRARIVKMTTAEGEEVEEGDLTQAVRDLEATDVPALQDYLSEADGGLDDTFPIECPKCGAENDERPAPFIVAPGFWGFSQKRRKPR